MLTGRVTEPQADALKAYAENAGLPLYQATVRALELGIAALAGPQDGEPVQAASASLDSDTIEGLRLSIENMIERHEAQADMLSQIVMRADLSDRLTQRALYAAGAAYAAALAGPGETEEHRAEIARDSDRIFARQLAKVQEE
ncbi:hypothetical protein [Croceicoccus hydrothermalis]|uniref:hypothetical protein n=1 Tax=Croceicoccus hydrothermalis TaxID=2867964 RepID=UPI001EFB1736|nr:hypothetical protein [Croceicoccus hydrothermalis]